MIPIVVGFDAREAIAYHTFCQSVLEKSSEPVSFMPLAPNTLRGYQEMHSDGSNAFIYSRFLTPFLRDYQGWAIFADGDMICCDDIAKLWAQRDETKAILVVKHDYKTKAKGKYLGNKNEDYPRKNWSSLMLWNCAHPKHRILDPEFVMHATGAQLHRFTWLDDSDIGSLEAGWNWLTTEYPDNADAHLLHYTLGTPCFIDYRNCDMADVWHEHFQRTVSGMQYDVPLSS
jgi:lipopolysaccharide biosynthesis glycosyltransferase